MPTVRQELEERVQQKCNFKEVAGAASLEAILNGRVTAPGCYIYKANISAKGKDLRGGTSQIIDEQYAFVVVTRNVRDARQGDGSDINELECQKLEAAVLGWSPPGTGDPMAYRGGRLVSLQHGYFYWQEIYSTQRLKRSSQEDV